jgi:DNA-binding CsgD family transcriptional regulator
VDGQIRADGVVGRDRQLTELWRALDAASRGAIGCVLSGPAGIGRTTLWRAGLAAATQRGYRVMSCRPAESEAGLSFAGLRDLLDDVPDPLLAGLPEPQRYAVEVALLRRSPGAAPPGPRAVQAALLGLVRAQATDAPVVLAIDDVQWLDPPSAQAIEYVVRRLTGERVGVLLTVRSDADADAGSPLRLERIWPADRVTRIDLDGLSLGALHRLVSTRTTTAFSRPVLRWIEHYSGGNPFFALELARTVDGRTGPGEPPALPYDVRDVVAGRIQQLPPSARRVVEVVALLAAPTVELVAAALDEPDRDGLRLAEQHGVVEVQRDHVRLIHPLFGAAAGTSGVARRRLHARLAELVDDAEQRAWHLALASERRDARVADALDKGAAEAQERGAPTSAAQLWELAALRTPEHDPTRSAIRAAAAGTALFHAGDTARARVLLDTAVETLAAGPERARVLLELADVDFHAGGTRRAVALCEQAFAESGAGERLLRIAAGVRRTWYGTHDLAAQLVSAEATVQLVTEADVADDPELAACAWLIAIDCRLFAGQGIDWDLLDRARRLLRPDSRAWTGDWARMTWRSLAKFVHPDLREVRTAYAVELALARDLGDDSAMGTLLMHLSEVDCWLGDWTVAADEARQSLDILGQAGSRRWRGFALYAYALVLAHAGDLDQARIAADEGAALAAEADDPWVAAMHESVLGFVALSRDEAAVADRHLTRAGEFVDAMGIAEPARHRFHGDQVEAALGVGDLDRAARLVDALTRRAEIAPYPWLLAITARSRAVLAMVRGDLDGAASAFEQAMVAHGDLPVPFERARTQLWYGRLLRRRKERLAAKALLSEALGTFTELGATLWAGRVAAELQRLGMRRGLVGDLTPTEQRIAELVASGMSNAEVAAAAFVTIKTVEANLARIYRKLGVSSRRELAALDGAFVGVFPDSSAEPST